MKKKKLNKEMSVYVRRLLVLFCCLLIFLTGCEKTPKEKEVNSPVQTPVNTDSESQSESEEEYAEQDEVEEALDELWNQLDELDNILEGID